MINLMLGGPRSGKSYESTVYHILPSLEQGRKVVTNLPIDIEAFCAINSDYRKLIRKIDDEPNVKAFSLQEHWHDDWKDPATGRGPLFVVDEVHFIMRRGETPKWLNELASMHGHYGYDWLLITQSCGKISKEICDMVQLTYFVRKMVAWGKTDSYIRKVYDGLKRPSHPDIQTNIRKYIPAYFKLYKSHTHSNSAVIEFEGSDVTPAFRKWKWASFVLLLLFIPLAYKAFVSFKGMGSQQTEQPIAATKAASKPLPSTAPPLASAPAVTEKPTDMEKDPFEGMHVYIKANISNAHKTLWLFGVSRDGVELMTQTGVQLADAGYAIRAVNDCLAIVSHPRMARPFYVYCDSPRPPQTKAIAVAGPDVGAAVAAAGSGVKRGVSGGVRSDQ